MKSLITILLTIGILFGAPVASAFEFTTTFPAPKGKTPIVDGEWSSDEWDDAVRVELLGGGEMLLKHDDAYLYVLIHAKRRGIASVCVERANGISVLHASAALGTAEYAGRFDNAERTRHFRFELRDTGPSLDAKKARKRFIHDESWFANTSRKGDVVREFQISLDIAEEHGRIPLAVTFFMLEKERVAYWPEDLSDDCLNMELIKGNAPEKLDFAPHRWPVVTIEKCTPVGDE